LSTDEPSRRSSFRGIPVPHLVSDREIFPADACRG